MKFEGYKVFDGPTAATEESKVLLRDAVAGLAERDPEGVSGHTFWLANVREIAHLVQAAELKLEYVIERDELVARRETKRREIDLVETRVVVFDWVNGILMLEDRMFRDRGDLDKPASIEALRTLLSHAAAEGGLEPLEPVLLSVRRDVSYIRRLYTTMESRYVEVSNLHGRTIPDDTKIYNPREDHEQFIRELLDEETKIIDKVAITSIPDGDLGKSHLAKAAVLAGDPTEIRYREQDAHAATVEHVAKVGRDEVVSVDIGVSAVTNAALLEALAIIHEAIAREGLLGEVRIVVRPRQQGGLFNEE